MNEFLADPVRNAPARVAGGFGRHCAIGSGEEVTVAFGATSEHVVIYPHAVMGEAGGQHAAFACLIDVGNKLTEGGEVSIVVGQCVEDCRLVKVGLRNDLFFGYVVPSV